MKRRFPSFPLCLTLLILPGCSQLDHSPHEKDHEADHTHPHPHSQPHDEIKSEAHNYFPLKKNVETSAQHDLPTAVIDFPQQMQQRFAIETAHVSERVFSQSIKAWGSIQPTQNGEAVVTAPCSGRLIFPRSGPPALGSQVEPGDILFHINPKLTNGGEIESLALDVETSELNVRLAKLELDRTTRLLEKGAVSQKHFEQAEADYAAAQVARESARKRARRNKAVFENKKGRTLRIVSPIKGTTTTLEARPGAFVEEGQVLSTVTDMDKLWLEAKVPESKIGSLGEGGDAVFTINGYSEPFHVSKSALVWVGESVDPATRTVPVVYELDNKERRLKVGLFADVRIGTTKGESSLSIPTDGIVRQGPHSFVFVKTGPDTFEKRTVTLGQTGPVNTAVLEGISFGESVVIRGAYTLLLSSLESVEAGHGHTH